MKFLLVQLLPLSSYSASFRPRFPNTVYHMPLTQIHILEELEATSDVPIKNFVLNSEGF
jgi:hypothetical protein